MMAPFAAWIMLSIGTGLASPRLRPGDRVTVCWRGTSPRDLFVVAETFACDGYVLVQQAPFSGGGLRPRALFDYVAAQVPGWHGGRIWARDVRRGADPADPMAEKTAIGKHDTGYLNDVVVRAKDRSLRIYLDIDLPE